MAKQDAKTAVPRLRFPQFRGNPWVPKTLEEIAPLQRGFDLPASALQPGNFPVVYSNGVQHFHNTAMAQAPGLVTGRSGTIGRLHFVESGEYWPHNTSLWVTSFKGNVPKFVYFLFDAIGMGRFASGSGVPTLNRNDVHAFASAVPSLLNEQHKIADCLTSLDEVIAAQGRKVEALKAHKRGLMQQLFPREGETIPRLRFPEFRDGLELRLNVLRALVKFSSGGTPSKAEPTYWDGNIPWISASSMHEMTIEDADRRVTKEAIGNGTRLAKKGCILVLVRGSMLFKRVPICITISDVAFNQDVKALAVASDVVAMFLLYQLIALSPRIPINETGIGAGKIETEVLENLEIWVPEIAEQQRIADCLTALDTQIAAESNQLAALKTHKQGLMQQLFPAPQALRA